MTTTEGDEVATRDDVTGIVHLRLRLAGYPPEDPRYAVFHRNVGANPFTEVDREAVAEREWCPLCLARHPGR